MFTKALKKKKEKKTGFARAAKFTLGCTFNNLATSGVHWFHEILNPEEYEDI